MNSEQCFTSYPDYEITTPTLRRMVPTPRPNYDGGLLAEIRETNRYLRYRIEEMNRRIMELEKFVEAERGV